MSVLIATPAYGGQLTVGYFNSVLEIVSSMEGVDVLCTSGESNICAGRNNLAATFMQGDWDTLAFLDADIEISPAHFKALVDLDYPIRGAAVAMKTADHRPFLSCWRKNEAGQMVAFNRDEETEPFECDYLGSAVLLIEKEVIQKFWEDENRHYHDDVVGDSCAIFENVIAHDHYLKEDYGFCIQARSMGYKIMCDPQVIVTHYGTGAWRA